MKHLLIIFSLFFAFTTPASAQKFLDKVLKGVEKTNKILDETDKLFGNDNTPTSSAGRKGGGFKIVPPNPNIEIKVTRCMAFGNNVLIDFILTNYGSDASIEFMRGSVAYDDLGNQYPNFTTGGGGDSEWNQKMLYPTEIPVKCRMTIDNVKENASNFKRINLAVYCPALKLNANTPIMFYNMPITRRDDSATIEPEEETTPTQNTENILEPTTEIDEDFDVFEDKFIKNPRFQMSRIIFNNLGWNGEEEKWTQENWVIFKNKPSDLKNSTEYKYEEKHTDNQHVQRIWVPDSEFTLEYTYSKIKGKWYLVKAFERF